MACDLANGVAQFDLVALGAGLGQGAALHSRVRRHAGHLRHHHLHHRFRACEQGVGDAEGVGALGLAIDLDMIRRFESHLMPALRFNQFVIQHNADRR